MGNSVSPSISTRPSTPETSNMSLLIDYKYGKHSSDIRTESLKHADTTVHAHVKRWRDVSYTTAGDFMFNGGPATAFCTLNRNSSAFGPTLLAGVI